MDFFDTSTYWAGKGTHQEMVEKLNQLIPPEGPVIGHANKHLEKFRKASNCYYDLYNNGLYNRAAEFRQVFGFGGKVAMSNKWHEITSRDLTIQRIELAMNQIVLNATKEQNLFV